MSRRVLAPSKTAARSACTAAGPGTCAVTPSGRSALTVERRSRTSSAGAVASVAFTGTTARAAVPSSLRCTGARPAPGTRPGPPPRPGQPRQARVDGRQARRAERARALAEEHDRRGTLGLRQTVTQLDGGRAVGAGGQGVCRAGGALGLADGAHDAHRPGEGQDDGPHGPPLVRHPVGHRTHATPPAMMSNWVTQ